MRWFVGLRPRPPWAGLRMLPKRQVPFCAPLKLNPRSAAAHYPILQKCKKYRITFKYTTKDPTEISLWKIYMLVNYQNMSSNKMFGNFFGLKLTSYLRDTCNIYFPINQQDWKIQRLSTHKGSSTCYRWTCQTWWNHIQWQRVKGLKRYLLEKEPTTTLPINLYGLP